MAEKHFCCSSALPGPACGCLPVHREHLFSTIRYLNSAPTYQLAYWSYFPPNSSTAIGTLLMCGNLILHMCTIKCPNSGQPQTHISQSQTSITDQMSAMMTINAMASEHWPELRDEMTLTLTYDPVMHDHSTQPVTRSELSVPTPDFILSKSSELSGEPGQF